LDTETSGDLSRYWSWPWVAINGPVNLDLQRRVDFNSSSRFDVLDCQTKILGDRTKPSDPQLMFGVVESGTLTVCGGLKRAEWIRHDPISARCQIWVLRKRPEEDGGALLHARMLPDALEHKFEHSDAPSIPVYLLKLSVKRAETGLVLRKKERDRIHKIKPVHDLASSFQQCLL